MCYYSIEDVSSIINNHETISLEETKSVSLLKRVDNKFLMSQKDLPKFLENLKEYYYIVEISDQRILPYYTIYFDTPDLFYYRMHHNGKLNRHKLRSRKYLVGGQVFNEIKFKINKGKTFKSRIERSNLHLHFDEKFKNFALESYPVLKEDLVPSLHVMYNRITFVDRNYTERMTIDTHLKVSHSSNNFHFSNLSIIELKRDQGNRISPGEKLLKEIRCKKNGFSKYCIGIAKTHNDIKTNNFKEKIRTVEKLCA